MTGDAHFTHPATFQQKEADFHSYTRFKMDLHPLRMETSLHLSSEMTNPWTTKQRKRGKSCFGGESLKAKKRKVTECVTTAVSNRTHQLGSSNSRTRPQRGWRPAGDRGWNRLVWTPASANPKRDPTIPSWSPPGLCFRRGRRTARLSPPPAPCRQTEQGSHHLLLWIQLSGAHCPFYWENLDYVNYWCNYTSNHLGCRLTLIIISMNAKPFFLHG